MTDERECVDDSVMEGKEEFDDSAYVDPASELTRPSAVDGL